MSQSKNTTNTFSPVSDKIRAALEKHSHVMPLGGLENRKGKVIIEIDFNGNEHEEEVSNILIRSRVIVEKEAVHTVK